MLRGGAQKILLILAAFGGSCAVHERAVEGNFWVSIAVAIDYAMHIRYSRVGDDNRIGDFYAPRAVTCAGGFVAIAGRGEGEAQVKWRRVSLET